MQSITTPKEVNSSNQPDIVKWYNESLLLRYKQDNKVIKVHNVEKNDFLKLKNLSVKSPARYQMELLNLAKESDSVTYLTSSGDIDESVDERFEYNCPSCDDITKFQILKRAAHYSKCMMCGHRLSVIITDCGNCGDKRSFVKSSGDIHDTYTCENCESEI